MILKTLSPQSVEWQGQRFSCALGRSGIKVDKREGDGATPTGFFHFGTVYYRADRLEKPVTRLPLVAIQPDDGWCDDPKDVFYNQAIKLPYPASHEHLWRDDSLYDVVVTTSHNQNPVVPGAGSAIFIHLACFDDQKKYRLTAGCLALSLPDLQTILSTATRDAVWVV